MCTRDRKDMFYLIDKWRVHATPLFAICPLPLRGIGPNDLPELKAEGDREVSRGSYVDAYRLARHFVFYSWSCT